MSRPPALAEPRQLEDQMFQLKGNAEADAIEAKKHLESLPKNIQPETWDKLYHYVEAQAERPIAGAPEPVKLTPDEQSVFDKYVKPIRDQRQASYRELESLGYPPEQVDVEGRGVTAPGYTPRYVAGRTRSFGEMLDRWKQAAQETHLGGVAKRSMRKTVEAQKARRFYIARNSDGENLVVHVGTDGRVLAFTGDATPKEVGTFPRGQRVAAGSKVNLGGETAILEPATTKEIESVAKTRYSTNIMANELDSLVKLRSAVRNAKWIKAMTESPEWESYSVPYKDTPVAPIDPATNRAWRVPKLPQFRQWYVKPEIADALDDFSRDVMTGEGLDTALNKIGRALNFVMFLNPKMHFDNMLNHMNVERGLVGNIVHAPSTAINLTRAMRSVLRVDKDYIRTLRSGASLPYSRMLSGDLHDTVLKTLGQVVRKDAPAWDRIAQNFGYLSARMMVRQLARVPQRVLWLSNDIMVMSRIKQLQARGMSLEQAFKSEERGIPNYRVPGQVMFKGKGGRIIHELFANPTFGRFGRYQYGRLASYASMVKKAFGPNMSLSERANALDRMAMLGVYLYLIYPFFDWAWQGLTGNPNATTVRSGATSIPYAIQQAAEGKKKTGDVLQNIYTPGVPVTLPIEMYYGRYLWNGEPIIRDADVRAGRDDRVLEDAINYGLQNLSTLGMVLAPEGRQTLGEIGLRSLGVISPQPGSVQTREYYMRKDEQSAKGRAMRLDRRKEQTQ